mgnify:CR=1 FL=1
MQLGRFAGFCLAVFSCLVLTFRTRAAETFTIGTYNLEMYLDSPALQHEPKSEESKAKVRESIKLMAADVLAASDEPREALEPR